MPDKNETLPNIDMAPEESVDSRIEPLFDPTRASYDYFKQLREQPIMTLESLQTLRRQEGRAEE